MNDADPISKDVGNVWQSHEIQEKKEEIWLNPMTKAPTPTEKSKK